MNLCLECIEIYDYNMISFYELLKIVTIKRNQIGVVDKSSAM